MEVNLSAMKLTIITLLTTVGLKILGAIAIWIIGRWLIGLALRMIGAALTKQKIDPTLIRYIHSAVAALLNLALVIAILGFFGVETTSFAALIAAAGVAIGMAWSATFQGRRLHRRRRGDGNGRGDRPVCHNGEHARQR